jgi:hypothetical protein
VDESHPSETNLVCHLCFNSSAVYGFLKWIFLGVGRVTGAMTTYRDRIFLIKLFQINKFFVRHIDPIKTTHYVCVYLENNLVWLSTMIDDYGDYGLMEIVIINGICHHQTNS